MKAIKENEWIKPKMKGFIQECCDCGLRHEIDFKVFYEDKKNRLRLDLED